MRIEFRLIKKVKLYNMLQQVTLKGLRIPHSGFRIPDSLPSTNPTKTWPLLPLLRWVKTIATWKTVIGSMQSLGMDNFRVAFPDFSLSILTILQDFRMTKRRRNGKVRQVSPLTP